MARIWIVETCAKAAVPHLRQAGGGRIVNFAESRRRIPLGRLGQPDDVAGLAVFLASSESRYVTGSTYLVDGGLSVFYEEQ